MRDSWFRFIPTTRLDHYRHATRPWPRAIFDASDFHTRNVRDGRVRFSKSRASSSEAKEEGHPRGDRSERCVDVYSKQFYLQSRLTRDLVESSLCRGVAPLIVNTVTKYHFLAPSITHQMPRSPSPPRGPRRRSPQPRETRDRDRSRSRSPPRGPRKAKELSFYKKSSSSLGSSSQRRDPFDDESARVRMERRDRGEVPARFGGTREQGVRNTMSAVAPVGSSSMGSLKRTADPLDRMRVKGGNERREDGPGDKGGVETGGPRRNGDQAREERVSAMEKTERRPAAQPTPGPV